MPFDENDDKEETELSQKKIGVKLNNKNSILGAIPKKPSKEEFESKAAMVNDQLNAYGDRAADLTLKFKKVLEDRTLSTNKTSFSSDAERELISNLAQLGIDMNNDEHEEKDGMGGIGLIILLLRTVLIQRDKINTLDYALNQVEKKLKELVPGSIDIKK